MKLYMVTNEFTRGYAKTSLTEDEFLLSECYDLNPNPYIRRAKRLEKKLGKNTRDFYRWEK